MDRKILTVRCEVCNVQFYCLEGSIAYNERICPTCSQSQAIKKVYSLFDTMGKQEEGLEPRPIQAVIDAVIAKIPLGRPIYDADTPRIAEDIRGILWNYQNEVLAMANERRAEGTQEDYTGTSSFTGRNIDFHGKITFDPDNGFMIIGKHEGDRQSQSPSSRGDMYAEPLHEEYDGVPRSEPVFIIRASDVLALPVIKAYMDLATSLGQHWEFVARISAQMERIRNWQRVHGRKIPE